MKRFHDTSVLVAAAVAAHPRHAPSFAVLERAQPATDGCAAQCLAELYAVLTRRTGDYRFEPAQALLTLAALPRHLAVVGLGGKQYLRSLERAAAAGITGNLIFDFLIACCAEAAGAETIYTWNVSDFGRFRSSVRLAVVSPAGSPPTP